MQNRVLLIIALPLIGALYFAAVGIADKINTDNEAAQTELAHNLTELRQALEKEKDASALFLGSKGAGFASELLAQRAKTDKRITELQSFILGNFAIKNTGSKYGPDFKQKFSLVLDKLGKLKTCRSSVSSLSIARSEVMGYYEDLSSSLSDLQQNKRQGLWEVP